LLRNVTRFNPMAKSSGKKNAKAFEWFIAERNRLKDWDDYVAPDRSRLLRGKIVGACGFSRSVLLQNRAVSGRLLRLEKDLRRRSVLRAVDEDAGEELLKVETDRDERIGSLEDRAGVLETSVRELRRSIEAVEQRIDEILPG